MPEVDSSAFYAVAVARWVPANFGAVNLTVLDTSSLKAYSSSSGDQGFFEGLKTLNGGACHLSLPLVSFDVFHIAIHDSKLTGKTKAHVYFRIKSWAVSAAGASTIGLEIVEKPKMDGKKTSAESTKFSRRDDVKAEVARIAGVLFNGCKAN